MCSLRFVEPRSGFVALSQKVSNNFLFFFINFEKYHENLYFWENDILTLVGD